MSNSIRQDVVRYLTDRPGQVIYRRDVSSGTGWDERQIRDTIRRIQDDSAIGTEIETIMRGVAWRYVPRHPTSVGNGDGDVDPATNADLPLTTLIRQFMTSHPRRLVNLDQLVRYTGRSPFQVQVGVNNMRRIAANADVVAYLETVAAGKIWRFNPPDDWRPGRQSTAPTSPVAPPTATTRTTFPDVDRTNASGSGQETVDDLRDEDDDDADADRSRVFEEVGKLRDGRLVISDEDGNMYTAVPMKAPTT